MSDLFNPPNTSTASPISPSEVAGRAQNAVDAQVAGATEVVAGVKAEVSSAVGQVEAYVAEYKQLLATVKSAPGLVKETIASIRDMIGDFLGLPEFKVLWWSGGPSHIPEDIYFARKKDGCPRYFQDLECYEMAWCCVNPVWSMEYALPQNIMMPLTDGNGIRDLFDQSPSSRLYFFSYLAEITGGMPWDEWRERKWREELGVPQGTHFVMKDGVVTWEKNLTPEQKLAMQITREQLPVSYFSQPGIKEKVASSLTALVAAKRAQANYPPQKHPYSELLAEALVAYPPGLQGDAKFLAEARAREALPDGTQPITFSVEEIAAAITKKYRYEVGPASESAVWWGKERARAERLLSARAPNPPPLESGSAEVKAQSSSKAPSTAGASTDFISSIFSFVDDLFTSIFGR